MSSLPQRREASTVRQRAAGPARRAEAVRDPIARTRRTYLYKPGGRLGQEVLLVADAISSRMWRSLAVVGGAALLVVGCSATGGSPAPSAAPAASEGAGGSYTLEVATDPTLGDILVGEDGRTLYIFTKDSGGKSVCNGDCATAWPPFVLEDGETVVAGDGVTGDLATVARDDGSMQVTYGGAPLYYFAADAKAGDVKGQALKGVWFVATPAGTTGGAAASPSGADGYSRGGGASASPAAAGTSAVTIADFSFAPATLTVPAGTTVTWTNQGSKPHTATADDGTFASGTLAKGDTFSQAFSTAGTYAYQCAIHAQMVGSVVVTP